MSSANTVEEIIDRVYSLEEETKNQDFFLTSLVKVESASKNVDEMFAKEYNLYTKKIDHFLLL